jgi:hypothetical protein
MDASAFDEHGRWLGTCDDCGTDHDGHGPGTFGAATRCLRARATTAGATHVLARLDQFEAEQAARRDELLRLRTILGDVGER